LAPRIRSSKLTRALARTVEGIAAYCQHAGDDHQRVARADIPSGLDRTRNVEAVDGLFAKQQTVIVAGLITNPLGVGIAAVSFAAAAAAR
jgi:hypothetical protein